MATMTTNAPVVLVAFRFFSARGTIDNSGTGGTAAPVPQIIPDFRFLLCTLYFALCTFFVLLLYASVLTTQFLHKPRTLETLFVSEMGLRKSMNDKAQVKTLLRDIYNRWEYFLASLSEAQITVPNHFGHWSIKDVVAHLRAWQQVSIARLEAALEDHEPEFSDWPPGFDPEPPTHADLDKINAWVYETHRDQPWPQVHAEWRAGFVHFLDLAQAIPEAELFERGRHPWLDDYPLAAVLEGSCAHHEEHLEPLLAGV
jgi:hypothetical protein